MEFERWKSLMAAFSFAENTTTYHALIKAYSEKHRAYHTQEHVEACLRHLDDVVQLADRPHEIELSLWFHDAIYKPFSLTNEKDSAIWAQEFFELNEFDDDDVIDRVYDLIKVTEHTGQATTNDQQLMLDIDLSILGSNTTTYDQFEKDVRHEYKRVPTFIFRKKRREILGEFLARDSIYHHTHFQHKLEAQARTNLARAIKNLS